MYGHKMSTNKKYIKVLNLILILNKKLSWRNCPFHSAAFHLRSVCQRTGIHDDPCLVGTFPASLVLLSTKVCIEWAKALLPALGIHSVVSACQTGVQSVTKFL